MNSPGVHLAPQRPHERLQLVAACNAQAQQQVGAQRGARLRVVGCQVRRPRLLQLRRVSAFVQICGGITRCLLRHYAKAADGPTDRCAAADTADGWDAQKDVGNQDRCSQLTTSRQVQSKSLYT